jgi:hypothetical protein
MMPINFPGARVIGKPANMTDEQCMSMYAKPVEVNYGKGEDGQDIKGIMWVEAWQPNKEDIDAINRGEPVWIQIHSNGLPPVGVCTHDENGDINE